MTIAYEKHNGSTRYSFHCDLTKPHDKGKYIARFANTVAEIKRRAKAYLGHSNFELTFDPMLNDQAERQPREPRT
jgi:hypothetical protein